MTEEAPKRFKEGDKMEAQSLLVGDNHNDNDDNDRVYELPVSSPSPAARWIDSAQQVAVLVTVAPLYVVLGSFNTVAGWLLPAVKRSIVAKFIPYSCCFPAKYFAAHRDELLADNIKETDTVLDAGSGGGMYMKYFTKAREVVAVEPVKELAETILQSAKKAGIASSKLTIVSATLEEYEASSNNKKQFDWIVLGNILCEVKDQQVVLDCIDRLLRKPNEDQHGYCGGGTVFFSEHVGNPKGSVVRFLQDVINPWWRATSVGCNLNRDTIDAIRAMQPKWSVISWCYFYQLTYWGIGLARKVK